MASFSYGMLNDKQKIGVTLRMYDPDFIKKIKNVGRMRFFEVIREVKVVEIKTIDNTKGAFLEVRCQRITFRKMFDLVLGLLGINTKFKPERYIVFTHWFPEDKNWSVEANYGKGEKLIDKI